MSISMKSANRPLYDMIKSLGFCLLVLLAVCGDAQSALAALDFTEIPKVSEYKDELDKEFDKKTSVFKVEEPYGEKSLGYEIRLPEGWIADSADKRVDDVIAGPKKLSNNVLAILQRYTSPPKNLYRSTAVVEALQLPYGITVKTWFINFALTNGFTLTALTIKSAREMEALYVQVIKDEAYVVRARVLINGNKLIMIRYNLFQDNYAEEQIQQAQVLSSFKLLSEDEAVIESRKTYGFIDQSFFDYPVSWALKERPILTVDRMSVSIMQGQGGTFNNVLQGDMTVNVISRMLDTSLNEEIEYFRKNLQIENYKIGKFIEDVQYKYDASMRSGRAKIYELEPLDPTKLQSYELIVAAMESDNYYYVTSMISPSRNQNYLVWGRNMEAARIVNESVRLNNMPGIDKNDPYYDYLKE